MRSKERERRTKGFRTNQVSPFSNQFSFQSIFVPSILALLELRSHDTSKPLNLSCRILPPGYFSNPPLYYLIQHFLTAFHRLDFSVYSYRFKQSRAGVRSGRVGSCKRVGKEKIEGSEATALLRLRSNREGVLGSILLVHRCPNV